MIDKCKICGKEMYSYCTKCDNAYCEEHAAIVNKRYDCCISCDDVNGEEDIEAPRLRNRIKSLLTKNNFGKIL